MAIIFISPKKRQRMFFWIITALLILFLFIISLIIFPPQFRNESQDIPAEEVFDVPDIKINFNVMDSAEVKNLELFGDMEIEFTYIAQDKNGKKIIGKISAITKDDAKKILEEMGLEVSSLEETRTGRSEPFVPYHQSIQQPVLKK